MKALFVFFLSVILTHTAKPADRQILFWWASECQNNQELIIQNLTELDSSDLHFIASRKNVGDKILKDSSITTIKANCPNALGQTPLHIAAMFGVKRNYLYLVLAQADLNAVDLNNTTADAYSPATEDGQWIKDFTAMIREKMFDEDMSQEQAVRACRDFSGNYDKTVKKWVQEQQRHLITEQLSSGDSDLTITSKNSFTSFATTKKSAHEHRDSDTEYSGDISHKDSFLPTEDEIRRILKRG